MPVSLRQSLQECWFNMKINMNNKEHYIQRINQALDTIRPHLLADQGDIEFVELTDDMIVKVKWLGTCETCSMSSMTMKAGIEFTIKSQIPEINSVVAVNNN